MKCPASPDAVNVNKTDRGDYIRRIGVWASGAPRKFYLGKDESLAKVKAFDLWKQWETAVEEKGYRTWEEIEGKPDIMNDAALFKVSAKRIAASSLAGAKAAYLASLQKRIGLMGGLGITQHTYDMTEYRLGRVLSFLPESVTSMKQLDYKTLEGLIYHVASRPKMLPTYKAKLATKKRQQKQQVSQQTAFGWIGALKAFLLWAAEEESTEFTVPRHARDLWKIRPEAEEQHIRTISKEEFKTLWDGTINTNAKGEDKGERRRLFILLGLNCGFYPVDIVTLDKANVIDEMEDDGIRVKASYIWKLRRKTRKTNSKLARTKWILWHETRLLLEKYMPLEGLSTNNIRLAWTRLTKATGVKVAFSNLRDTGAVYMEKKGGRELADTYLAHARKGPIDSYSHPDWEKMSEALMALYFEVVQPVVNPAAALRRQQHLERMKAQAAKAS